MSVLANQMSSSPPPPSPPNNISTMLCRDSHVETISSPTITTAPKKPHHLSKQFGKPATFEPPASLNNAKILKDDLKSLGFSTARVKELVSRKEPVVDGHAQVPQGNSRVAAADKISGQSGKGERAQRVRKGGLYEHLFLDGRSKDERLDWALFDTLRGFPRDFGSLPDAFLQYELFKPGNRKILEYNVVSRAVRVRCTPKAFEGNDVRYSDRVGPKLVEASRVGKRKGGRGSEVMIEVKTEVKMQVKMEVEDSDESVDGCW